MLTEILINGGESCLFDGSCTNFIREGLYNPVNGASKFPVPRDGCEVLRRKNNKGLKEDQDLQVAFQTHCLEIEMWQAGE